MDHSGESESAGPSSGGAPEFQFLDGQKGRLLVRARYRFYLHHTSGDGSQMWKCLKRSCPAKLKISSNQRILREDKNKCNLESVVVEEFKEECIKRAQTEVTSIPKIHAETYKNFVDKGYDLIDDAVSFNSLKSLMYRARNSKLKVSKTTFKEPDQVEIPTSFEDFVLFRNNKFGIFAFATVEGRKKLEQNKTFFMDGTFLSCPKPFYQVYSIHVDDGSNELQTLICPVVFILLSNKEQNTYEIMLNLLKQNLPRWSPEFFLVDFEMAVINALRKSFPNALIKGCNFHFKQALLKKSKDVGIKTQEECQHVAQCGALSHIPIEFVEDGWLAIMEEAPNSESVIKFNNYFVSTWLDSTSFSIDLWNCEGQRHRTTNLVESWHKRLNNLINKNPRLLTFLQIIKEEALYFERYRCIPNVNRSRQSINRDLKLSLIVKHLREQKITILQALQQISK